MWVNAAIVSDILRSSDTALAPRGRERRRGNRERSAVGLSRARRASVVIGLVTTAIVAVARPAAPQFTSFSRDPRNILEGHWQSCRESDGRYAERFYDHVVNGVGKFEVHMGPRREFAIFNNVQDEHRDHASPENLLKPYTIP